MHMHQYIIKSSITTNSYVQFYTYPNLDYEEYRNKYNDNHKTC